MSTRQRLGIAVFVALMPLLLGCEWLLELANSPASSTVPRWACPTPTPLPYGNQGPVKRYRDGAPDPTTGIPEREAEYYEVWEQEYGHLGDPAPAPTPYTKSGTIFHLGQIVNLGNGAIDLRFWVDATGTISDTDELYLVHLQWENRSAPFPFVAGRQVAISEILLPEGRKAAQAWVSSDAALRAAGIPSEDILRQEVPTGTSEQIVPIFAPSGAVQSAEVRFDVEGEAEGLRIRFIDAQERNCEAPGTYNAHYTDAAEAIVPPPIPPGTDELVAFALSQVGRPYCWGGKGFSPCDGFGGGPKQVTPSCQAQGGYPCWDCSGLAWGAYNAVGTVIGHGTANQSRYAQVPLEHILPGDLMFFSSINAQNRAARITHVGIYAGDVNGDGTGDLVHAANYPDGVIITNNVLGNPWYKANLVVITRPPRT